MHADVIIVGGGLSGGLLALRLALAQPRPRVLLIERSGSLGGNHTWVFSATSSAPDWVKPLVSKNWSQFQVRFPKSNKGFEIPFYAIRSQDFNAGLRERLGMDVLVNCEAIEISDNHVKTRDGKVFRAPLIVDATGIHDDLINATDSLYSGIQCGWMKYMGFDLKVKRTAPEISMTEGPTHAVPTLMDARVPQMDGFRFFSTIPLDDETIYVQESFLSSTPHLNPHRMTRSLLAYVQRLGFEPDPRTPILRQEEALIPLPLFAFPDDRAIKINDLYTSGHGENFIDRSPIQISSANGWYHPTIGQAVSDAIRVAEFIASQPRLRTGPVRTAMREFRYHWVKQQAFYRTFNRMLFKASEPSLRHLAFDRLFSLKDDLIGRFLSGESSSADATKIFANKPPLRTGKIYRNWASEAPEETLAARKMES